MRAKTTALKLKLNNTVFYRILLDGLIGGQLDEDEREGKKFVSAERWYTKFTEESDFEAIERIMRCEKVAHNVVHVDEAFTAKNVLHITFNTI